MPEGLEKELLEDMENQVDLSAMALPSAIFYTFVNTHHSLNCTNFTANGALLAGELLRQRCQSVGCDVA
jgi:transcription initiation factor TFIID subunit 5